MKIVLGKVVSTMLISLSKATKAFSNFVAVEIGAYQAMSIYLRRALAFFSKLVQFHKELKGSKFNRKINNHTVETLEILDLVRDTEDSVRSGNTGKMHEMKKKKGKSGEVVDGKIVDLVE
ncbi:uncharacterized protein LOC127796912 [Diospyros lotus]|uniref:uncharacterized protein LOC127796912 n=1 Tax=Diospyros lotus TaxID=55363 RepID=UPI00224ED9CB|nr:uncharacterized protein LOC127796912 [Diospyros lotus]